MDKKRSQLEQAVRDCAVVMLTALGMVWLVWVLVQFILTNLQFVLHI